MSDSTKSPVVGRASTGKRSSSRSSKPVLDPQVTELRDLVGKTSWSATPVEKALRKGVAAAIVAKDRNKNYKKSLSSKRYIKEPIKSERINSDDYSKKWEMMDRFARANPGKPISDFGKQLFPRPSRDESRAVRTELPEVAPQIWKLHREGDETPPAFIGRVYSDWLGKGLTRAHIRNLDKPLWQALYNWLRHNKMPSSVELPTREEHNTKLLAEIGQGGLVTNEGTIGEHTLREARRLSEAQRRRDRSTERG